MTDRCFKLHRSFIHRPQQIEGDVKLIPLNRLICILFLPPGTSKKCSVSDLARRNKTSQVVTKLRRFNRNLSYWIDVAVSSVFEGTFEGFVEFIFVRNHVRTVAFRHSRQTVLSVILLNVCIGTVTAPMSIMLTLALA